MQDRARDKYAIYVAGRDRQKLLAKILASCRENRWKPPEDENKYIDTATGQGGRGDFRRMLKAAKGGAFSTLLFWGFDQLGARGADILKHLFNLNRWGLRWHDLETKWKNWGSCGEQNLNDFFQRVAEKDSHVRKTRSSDPIDQESRARRSERTKAQMAALKKADKPRGRRPTKIENVAKAIKLREEGAPIWFIQWALGTEWGKKPATSTVNLSRRLARVRKGNKPREYWVAIYEAAREKQNNRN